MSIFHAGNDSLAKPSNAIENHPAVPVMRSEGPSIDPCHQSTDFYPTNGFIDRIWRLYLLKLKVVQILFTTPRAEEGAVDDGYTFALFGVFQEALDSHPDGSLFAFVRQLS
jgi:hypothetical protein